jgi:hypothetical protein
MALGGMPSKVLFLRPLHFDWLRFAFAFVPYAPTSAPTGHNLQSFTQDRVHFST